MTTTPIRLNEDSYTLLTNASKFIIQNTGYKILQVVASDTQPADDANGINLEEHEAITEQHLVGSIWGKGDVTAIVGE
jgi:hypothetical protein